jgi:hypothetical protein
MFSLGIWWIGSRMNRCGSIAQGWRMSAQEALEGLEPAGEL